MLLTTMLTDIDHFLEESPYTPATIAGYGYHLKRMAGWLIDCCLEPGELTVQQLKSYLTGQDWRNNTQRQAGNAAKSFLRWRYGAMHPALTIRLPKDDAGPGRSLEADQLDRLLAIFDTTRPAGWRDISMLALMVETGIREREVCRLEIRHTHLQERRFDVLAKGEVWRPGIFSQVTAQYLDIWLSARKEVAYKDVPYVFVSVNGKTKGRGMTPGGLRANFRKFGVRAMIGELSPHDLRRTMAVLLTEAGAPTRLVQELGGWSDLRMVERYTRRLQVQQIDHYSPLVRVSIELLK